MGHNLGCFFLQRRNICSQFFRPGRKGDAIACNGVEGRCWDNPLLCLFLASRLKKSLQQFVKNMNLNVTCYTRDISVPYILLIFQDPAQGWPPPESHFASACNQSGSTLAYACGWQGRHTWAQPKLHTLTSGGEWWGVCWLLYVCWLLMQKMELIIYLPHWDWGANRLWGSQNMVGCSTSKKWWQFFPS